MPGKAECELVEGSVGVIDEMSESLWRSGCARR